VEVVVDGEVKRRGMNKARRDEELAALEQRKTDLRVGVG
jgi:hypothetical protein